MEGSLTAADTLMPRAFAAQQYTEVARLTIRSLCLGTVLLIIPIVPLSLFLSRILQALGQDREASHLAQAWIRVYFLGALPNLGFRVIMRFLLAQEKPWPLVWTSGVPALLIHPFLIGTLVDTMGLVGSAWSIVLVQWITLAFMMVHLYAFADFVPETWPGLSWTLIQKSLRWQPTWQFLRLSMGGILSMNEWWFYEITCFIAGSFGVVALDAHTVAYNLVPLVYMLPFGFSVGLAVRMGYVIADDPRRAKTMARWCIGLITVLGAHVSITLHFFRIQIIHLFTYDEGAFIVGFAAFVLMLG